MFPARSVADPVCVCVPTVVPPPVTAHPVARPDVASVAVQVDGAGSGSPKWYDEPAAGPPVNVTSGAVASLAT